MYYHSAASPEIVLPYGFPKAGRYRLSSRYGAGTVETGVFDAQE
jgi:hypothetical protein